MLNIVSVSPDGGDAALVRTAHLVDMPEGAGEIITLMLEILGWQQVPRERARLCLRGADGVIAVEAACPVVARQLAANGLDRLVLPVALPALEQLMVVAG